MNIYLKHLVAAFNLVDKKYHSSFAFCGGSPKNVEEDERQKFEQFIERVFAYELYHQFRIIMSNHSEKYKQLVLNGEISKNGFEDTYLGKNRIFPDLVLHKSQTNNNYQFQKLFIEIKTSEKISNPDLKSDIDKLIIAIGDRLNYQNAVFISINSNYNKLTKELKILLKDVDSKDCKKNLAINRLKKFSKL